MVTKTKFIIVAVVALVLAAGAFIYFTLPAVAPGPDSNTSGENPPIVTSTPNTPPTATPTSSVPVPKPIPTPTPAPSPAPNPQPPAPSGITMAQVATHSNSTSCWTVIRGNVYDLTTWISKHPGGKSAISKLCGRDGTNEFVDQHGGSAQQENTLATFKIGVLAQ